MDILLAWIAAIASGISPIIIKLSSKSLVKSPWLFNILWLFFAIPLVAVFALIQGAGLPENWIPVLLMSVSSALFFVFYTTSIYKINVSVMAPLFSLRAVFAVLIGVFLLGEKLEVLGVALVILIVLFSPFAAYDSKLKLKAFFQKPVLLAVAAMLSLAFMGYFTNRSVELNGSASTILWQDIITLLILLPTLKFVEFEKENISLKSIVPFIGLGMSGFIYIVASTEAYARNLALSSVIVSLPLSMIFAVMLSKKLPSLKENHSKEIYIIRFSAASLMIVCALLLSVV